MIACMGVGLFLIPIAISSIYKAIQFRATLDILGAFFAINAVAFAIHAVRNNWGCEAVRCRGEEEEEEEDQLLVKDEI